MVHPRDRRFLGRSRHGDSDGLLRLSRGVSTVASGTNIVTLSRLLGHHSPDFTLRRYAHLIPGDEIPCLDLDAELGSVAESILSPDRTGVDGTQRDAEPAERAYFQTVPA